ncbi:glycosyltransferase [Bacillus cereus]|uniref:glycosyltransferase n=1 Tax=Bacillus cereus TaxID=1396 RepID=UPI00356E3A79
MQKKKVMHIINSFSLAGAEKLVFDIASNINKEKYELYICSIGKSPNSSIEENIKKELVGNSIKVFCLDKKPKGDRIRTLRRLVKIIRNNSIDIIHTHCPSPDLYGRVAAKIMGIEDTYTTIHNSAGYSKFLENLLGRWTKGYIAISKQVRDYMHEKLLISEDKIHLVFNGIDVDKYKNIQINKEEYRLKLGLKSDDVVITTIGRVTEQKGHIFLVKAIKKVKEYYPNVRVLIVGNKGLDKVLYKKITDYVELEKLQENVSFLGNREDVPEIMKMSDVFVFPSLYEGFALVSLEAMASSIPIIATDVGSIREIIMPNKNGIIIPSKDVKSIEDNILYMLDNPVIAQSMGREGQKFIIDKFSIKQTTKKLEEIYG